MSKFLKNLELMEKEKLLTKQFSDKLNLIKKEKKKLNNKQNTFNINHFMNNQWLQWEENFNNTEIDLKISWEKINAEISEENENIKKKKNAYEIVLFNQIKILKDLLWKIKKNNIKFEDLNEDIKIGKLFQDINNFFQRGYKTLESEYNIVKNENSNFLNQIVKYNINKHKLEDEENLVLKIEEYMLKEVNCTQLIEEFNYITNKLKERLNLELEDINLSKIEIYEKLDTINFDKNILNIFNYFKNILNEKKLEDLFKTFLFIFKKIKRRDLLVYYTFSENLSFLKKNKLSIIKVYIKELNYVKTNIENKIEELYNQIEDKRKVNNEKIKWKMKKDILKHRIKEQKIMHNLKKREFERVKAEEEFNNNKEKIKIDNLYHKHCQDIKNIADKYKIEKHIKNENIKQKQIKIKEIESKNTKNKIIKNKEKILKREQELIQSKQNKINNKVSQLKEINDKKQRIWDIVENYKNKPIAVKNPDRLIKNTISLENRINSEPVNNKLFINHGYNNDGLLNDFRFKLQTYLFENNLNNTDYARNLMNNLSKNIKNN